MQSGYIVPFTDFVALLVFGAAFAVLLYQLLVALVLLVVLAEFLFFHDGCWLAFVLADFSNLYLLVTFILCCLWTLL